MTNTIVKIKPVKRKDAAQRELSNFAKTIKLFKPREGSLPKINGFDIYGVSMPKYAVGGDHITFMNFTTRFDLLSRIEDAKDNSEIVLELGKNCSRAGIYIMDVMGHQDTDALPAAMLHQAFISCAYYELKLFGQITPNVFEVLNTRFYESSGVEKTISAIYGEINENGTFKFISQGNPLPVVFSNEYNHFVKLKDITGADFNVSEPIGFRPSINHLDAAKYVCSPLGYKQPYHVNQIKLESPGDILLMFTDGISEHSRHAGGMGERYAESQLEKKIQEVKNESAMEICKAIAKDLKLFNPVRSDDITYVVVKKK